MRQGRFRFSQICVPIFVPIYESDFFVFIPSVQKSETKSETKSAVNLEELNFENNGNNTHGYTRGPRRLHLKALTTQSELPPSRKRIHARVCETRWRDQFGDGAWSSAKRGQMQIWRFWRVTEKSEAERLEVTGGDCGASSDRT